MNFSYFSNSNFFNNNGENNNLMEKDSFEDNKNVGDENYMKNINEIQFPNYTEDETIPLTWKVHEKDILKKIYYYMDIIDGIQLKQIVQIY